MSTVKEDLKVAKVKSDLQMFKQKYNKLLKDKVRQNDLITEMKDYVQALPEYKPMRALPKNHGEYEEIVVAPLSDLHIGAVTDPKDVNPDVSILGGGGFEKKALKQDFGYYDIPTAYRRLEQYVEKIVYLVSLHRSHSRIQDIYIPCLGDYIDGKIHEELVQYGAEHAVRQTAIAAHAISCFLVDLIPYFRHIYVLGLSGNHGRLDKQKQFQNRATFNLDHMVMQMVALRLANQKSISFNIPQSTHAVTKVNGHWMLFSHGDDVTMWNNIPYYSIDRMTKSWQKMLAPEDIYIEKVCVAHFHDSFSYDNVVINGSLKGGDAYSIRKLHKKSRPSQYMFGVHQERPETWSYTVWLEDTCKPMRYPMPDSDIWAEWAVQ
ncbi:MAG TPA: hypothetical protein PLC68_09035 [Caldisericia bacterium]|nr:hypothetical protein [Caldisericia bacterium]